MRNAKLILDDGREFHGKSFGYEANTTGEVVFCTAMIGYPECITDAAYAGQILALTYPIIGNCGEPNPQNDVNGLAAYVDGAKIYPRALVVTDYSEAYSHWNAVGTLAEWLKREKVPAITGVDTRELTKVLRENGVMKGRIVIEDCDEVAGQDDEAASYDEQIFVDKVALSEVQRYNEGAAKKVVFVNSGSGFTALCSLIEKGVEVISVPWNYDFNTLEFDALFLGSGPGNPALLMPLIEHVKAFFATEKVRPCLGLGLGHEIMALAAGGKVVKLKYGHRGSNQPVQEVGTTHSFVTGQNHGYAVDAKSLPADWKELYVNLNDGSCEGITHECNPWYSAQFNPEKCCAPVAMKSIYDKFISAL